MHQNSPDEQVTTLGKTQGLYVLQDSNPPIDCDVSFCTVLTNTSSTKRTSTAPIETLSAHCEVFKLIVHDYAELHQNSPS